MRETKKKMLSRKNAELNTIQARLRGIGSKLEPLSKSSNCTIAIMEILKLVDIAINQIDSFVDADALKLRGIKEGGSR
jgi:hypothetical protein